MPPDYFFRIEDSSRQRWNQLEADPELAGPWRQLFSQVQSPRHVLSEMLQNADDAGATWVDVSVNDGNFRFEHNGRDFEESEFASLCRFGYSNKRSLHTIGFRGIGFKSLFSLGSIVRLATPTLSVEFQSNRFTQPHWVPTQSHSDRTRIEVAIEDENRESELVKNFEQWRSSPLSLLFFNSVRKLRIQGHLIEKELLDDGPIENSSWVRLVGSKYDRLLHVRSAPEAFPDEAVEEIKRERNSDELNLPPCRVEIVLGEQDQRRLFVVLPTGVTPNLPFSCHAPFLQDPARFGIKAPATSPTNRWLLDRIGRLAAETMFAWLDNRSLTVRQRCEAYSLLPPPGARGDSLDASVTEQVSLGFRLGCQGQPMLLSDDGELAFQPNCVAVPAEVSLVWSSTQLDVLLQLDGAPCLSAEVDDGHRHQLEAWEWLSFISPNEVIQKLTEKRSVPKPESLHAIAALWTFVRRTNCRARDSKWRLAVCMVPVQGQPELRSAESIVRLSSRRADIPDSEWDFLSSFVSVIDNRWIEKLKEAVNDTGASAIHNTWFAESSALLKELGLDSPTSTDRLVAVVCREAVFNGSPDRQLLVRLTHIFAALEATVPDGYPYFNCLGERRAASEGIMADVDSTWEEILPSDFSDARIIHDDYDSGIVACNQAQWRRWAASPKSRLSALSILESRTQDFRTRDGFEKFLKSVGCTPPTEYQYKIASFRIADSAIPESVVNGLINRGTEPDAWAKLVAKLLEEPAEHWQDILYARVHEVANNKHLRKARVDPLPATWIRQLAAHPCLLDTYGRPCVPADLLLRTPDTEPLLGIDAFVSADLDTTENRPLLLLLGARDTSTGTERIVDRIRALASCDEPPIHALAKWYEALDRAATRAKPDELAQLREEFSSHRLIWTSDDQWSLASEVFCFSDTDTMPEAATIHPSVSGLPLWKRLGIADRPTLELVVKWLSQIKIGAKLETGTVRRLQACLKAFPSQIFDQLNAWLSLDNRWLPIEDFRYKHSGGGNLRVSDLFVGAKSHTADLRGIPANRIADGSFSQITELASAIEYVVSDVVQARVMGPAPDWMIAFGSTITRIVHADAEVQSRTRLFGQRMCDSSWQPVASLKVTPYLDAAPVGHSLSPSVLWTETTLFVHDTNLVEVIEDLVSELQRPFEFPAIAEAIRICIDRPSDFIARYLAGKFELELSATLCHDDGEAEIELESEGERQDSSPTPDPFDLSADIAPQGPQTQSESEVLPSERPLAEGDGELAERASAHQDDETAQIEESEAPQDFADVAGSPVQDTTSADVTSPSLAAQADDDPPTADPLAEDPTSAAPPSADSPSADSPSADSPSADSPSADLATAEKPQEPPKRSLVQRYAEMNDMTFIADQNMYLGNDGSRLLRSGGLFAYEFYDHAGGSERHIWLTSQFLSTGLEVPAEIWEVIRSTPESTAIVCEGADGQPLELSGNHLRQMLDEETLRLFPAKYRLKQIAETINASQETFAR